MLYLHLFCRFLKRDTFYESSHSFSQFVSILEFFAVIHVTLEKKCCVIDVLTTINHIKISYAYSLNPFLYRPFVNALFLVCYYESILLLPTAMTQFAAVLVRHVGIYMIIVYMFQISSCLNNQ